MRIAHESITSDLVDLELVKLKFIFNRCMCLVTGLTYILMLGTTVHHDNRDFDILPNFQPHSTPSFNEQTLLLGKSTGVQYIFLVCQAVGLLIGPY